MEAFPIEYVLYNRINGEFRLELTFERYQPFYRFKERVFDSTPEELDVCVSKLDEAPPKERALILTALYLFEKSRRPRPDAFEASTIDESERLAYFPYEPLSKPRRHNWELFVPYRPDPSISALKWNCWEQCIRKYCESRDPAFDSLNVDEDDLKYEWIYSIEDFVEQKIAKLDPTLPWREWNKLNYFRFALGYKATSQPDPTNSDFYHGIERQDDELTSAFLKKVDELEKSSPNSKDVKELMAFREYLFTTQSVYLDPKYAYFYPAGVTKRNYSRAPKTLGSIASLLTKGRIAY